MMLQKWGQYKTRVGLFELLPVTVIQSQTVQCGEKPQVVGGHFRILGDQTVEMRGVLVLAEREIKVGDLHVEVEFPRKLLQRQLRRPIGRFQIKSERLRVILGKDPVNGGGVEHRAQAQGLETLLAGQAGDPDQIFRKLFGRVFRRGDITALAALEKPHMPFDPAPVELPCARRICCGSLRKKPHQFDPCERVARKKAVAEGLIRFEICSAGLAVDHSQQRIGGALCKERATADERRQTKHVYFQRAYRIHAQI